MDYGVHNENHIRACDWEAIGQLTDTPHAPGRAHSFAVRLAPVSVSQLANNTSLSCARQMLCNLSEVASCLTERLQVGLVVGCRCSCVGACFHKSASHLSGCA